MKTDAGFDPRGSFATGSSEIFVAHFHTSNLLLKDNFPMLQMTDLLRLSGSEANINQTLGKSVFSFLFLFCCC